LRDHSQDTAQVNRIKRRRELYPAQHFICASRLLIPSNHLRAARSVQFAVLVRTAYRRTVTCFRNHCLFSEPTQRCFLIMDKTRLVDGGLGFNSAPRVISKGYPGTWTLCCALDFLQAFQLGRTTLITTLIALAVSLSVLLLAALTKYIKMQDDNRKPFAFLALPQELRDMVYENLIENPTVHYPPPPASTKLTSAIKWMLPSHWTTISPPSQHSTWLLLANCQIYKEYMDLFCKRTTFVLAVSPKNYQPPPLQTSTPTNTSTFTSSTSRENIWPIAPSTLPQIRSCELKLITTSAMLGVSDPRAMTSASWPLAAQIRNELSAMTNVRELTLNAKAIGDRLWNPVWIWYHASQSFKTMGTPTCTSTSTSGDDEQNKGPKLTRITFSLDTWSPGENYLRREGDDEGVWMWHCMQGHRVCVDGGVDMTIREFCGKLFQECEVCKPEFGG
jgi:hypothetical protein